MAKRKKRLEKRVKGLQKQITKHNTKLEEEKVDETIERYWKKEISKLKEQKQKTQSILDRKIKEKKR